MTLLAVIRGQQYYINENGVRCSADRRGSSLQQPAGKNAETVELGAGTNLPANKKREQTCKYGTRGESGVLLSSFQRSVVFDWRGFVQALGPDPRRSRL